MKHVENSIYTHAIVIEQPFTLRPIKVRCKSIIFVLFSNFIDVN